MAQYYQVLSQTDNTTGEIRQFYQNIDENQTVQYVITPDDHHQQQQFQTEQVVVSSEQLMLVDGQPQQVILNQSQIAYQEPSYIVEDHAVINFQQNRQQQSIYYMTDNNVTTEQHNSSIEAIEQQSQVQPPVEPVVLNHHLAGQVPPPPPPVTVRVHHQRQQVCPVPSSIQPTQQLDEVQETISQPLMVAQPKLSTVPRMQVIMQPQQNDQPSLTLQNLQQRKNIRITPIQSEGKSTAIVNQGNSLETVTLSDGSIMPYGQFKKLIAQQKSQMLQERLSAPVVVPATSTTAATSRKPRAPPNPNNRGRANRNVRGRGGVAAVRGIVGNKDLLLNENQHVLHQQQSVVNNKQLQLLQQQQQQQLAQSHFPVNDSLHDTMLQQQQQQKLQQQQQQQQPQYLIKPPRPHAKQKACPLPPFLHSSQIRHIIESTPISEEYSDSIRMLVLLENGEQRLITFTLPKEACTIYEILDQVNVPYQADTPIQVNEFNTNGINYVVTVGNVLFNSDSLSQGEELSADDGGSYSQPSAVVVETTANNNNKNIQQQQQQVQELREPSPEPAELPKLIQGQLAVCNYCGYVSDDFNRCTRCKRKLPDNVKAIPAATAGNTNGKKLDCKLLGDKKMPQMCGKGLGKSNVTLRKKVKPRIIENETVILSSDEEDGDQKNENNPTNEEILDKLGTSITISPISKEPSILDIKKNSDSLDNLDPSSLENTVAEIQDFTVFRCRTIRIGSYRFSPTDDVIIDGFGITLHVPHPKTQTIKQIKIDRHEIVKVLVSFQKSLPVVFYYLIPSAGHAICALLDMEKGSDIYFDPLSEVNETHRRITLLPDHFTDDMKLNMKKIYAHQSLTPPFTSNILEELTPKEANHILMKSCPKELAKSAIGFGQLTEIKQLLSYPPTGPGRLSINTEDYMCLAQEQFLNDVIIDFYLKFTIEQYLSKEVQDKIHVFSTFFYNRLTTKPVKASRKSQPSESDASLTPAQKRHARVKTWTKNINIFQKDFIIIPLNENCHWFLAIICYPGMNGPHTMRNEPITIETTRTSTNKRKKSIQITINNVTIATFKTEKPEKPIVCEDSELSDKDEADGDDSELDSDDSEEPPPPVVTTTETLSKRPPIKQPCILIFDSLAGASRSRVVATLRDYLTCEYKAKMNVDRIYTKDVIKGACPKVPQQTNFTDCGLYLLQYVEQFFKCPIKDYYIPINHLKTWFDEKDVTRKREDISLIIKNLMKQQGGDTSLLPEITFPTLNGEIVDKMATAPEEAEDTFREDDGEMEEGEIEGNNELDSGAAGEDSSISCLSTTNSISEPSQSDQSALMKPSQDGVTTATSNDNMTINTACLKPDLSEVSRQQSNKDALSYLKAKRIIRHNKSNVSDGPDAKKVKSNVDT